MVSTSFGMKTRLLIQSLSPLAFLTFVKNFPFTTIGNVGNNLSLLEYVMQNPVLSAVEGTCFLWIFLSAWYFIEFKAFTWADKKSGYEIKCVKDRDENSLNFFITIIVPLLINDAGTLNGALTLGLIVLFLCFLLYNTKLFYSNPVLTVLGYRFYEFQFKENSEIQGICVGISRNAVKDDSVIEYKQISDNVFYIRGRDNGQK